VLTIRAPAGGDHLHISNRVAPLAGDRRTLVGDRCDAPAEALAARRLSSSTKASDLTSVVLWDAPAEALAARRLSSSTKASDHTSVVLCDAPTGTIGGTATFIIHKGFRSYVSGPVGCSAEPHPQRLPIIRRWSCGMLRRATSTKASDHTSVVLCDAPTGTIGGTVTFIIHKGFRSYVSGPVGCSSWHYRRYGNLHHPQRFPTYISDLATSLAPLAARRLSLFTTACLRRCCRRISDGSVPAATSDRSSIGPKNQVIVCGSNINVDDLAEQALEHSYRFLIALRS